MAVAALLSVVLNLCYICVSLGDDAITDVVDGSVSDGSRFDYGFLATSCFGQLKRPCPRLLNRFLGARCSWEEI